MCSLENSSFSRTRPEACIYTFHHQKRRKGKRRHIRHGSVDHGIGLFRLGKLTGQQRTEMKRSIRGA